MPSCVPSAPPTRSTVGPPLDRSEGRGRMDLLQHTPALTRETASTIARDVYGLHADASPLPGERDQNFLLRTLAGNSFVLKIANAADSRSLLEAQSAALAHV